jgi:diphthamide biosynthesis protein 7
MAKNLSTCKTKLHPCSIEKLLNINLPSEKYFIVGSYELNELSATRIGRIDIFDKKCEFKACSEVDAGILDLKVISTNKFVYADSKGYLVFNQICSDESMLKVDVIGSFRASDYTGLALSLDWNSFPHANDLTENFVSNNSSIYGNNRYIVSYQNGSVALIGHDSTGDLCLMKLIENCHQMRGENQPVWIATFNKHVNDVFLTGGDDCTLKLWDTRQGYNPIHVNRNHHQAGVTSAQWHPAKPNIFVSGSYDASIKIWDDRIMRSPLLDISAGKVIKISLLYDVIILIRCIKL